MKLKQSWRAIQLVCKLARESYHTKGLNDTSYVAAAEDRYVKLYLKQRGPRLLAKETISPGTIEDFLMQTYLPALKPFQVEIQRLIAPHVETPQLHPQALKQHLLLESGGCRDCRKKLLDFLRSLDFLDPPSPNGKHRTAAIICLNDHFQGRHLELTLEDIHKLVNASITHSYDPLLIGSVASFDIAYGHTQFCPRCQQELNQPPG